MNRREFLGSVAAAAVSGAERAEARDTVLWYRQPADQWTDALPIGNGRLGAMVFGGVEKERLQLNEDTLWSGGPREWDNPEAKQYLPEVRRLVLQDKNYTGADRVCLKMQGPYNQSYLPLADLRLAFEHGGAASEYRRELDLDTAVSRVTYRVGETGFTRDAFASAPDQAIVVRLSATRPGSVTLAVAMDSPLKFMCEAEGRDTLRLYGKAPVHVDPNYVRSDHPIVYDDSDSSKGMRFEARLKVLAKGGTVRADGNQLRIERADSVTIVVVAATGYKGFDKAPDTPADAIAAKSRGRIEAAARRTSEQLRAQHVADHQRLFRRVSLNLGAAKTAELPTDERLKAFKDTQDPELVALYFQYGRYLLIASSRPGTQPANLQGIWNESVQPPWSSNWTANINVQMNYWLAETGNLSECHEPLFDLIEGVSRTGREDGRGQLWAEGLGVASQHRCVAAIGAGGQLRARARQRGPTGR